MILVIIIHSFRKGQPNLVRDTFQQTPPISTFTLGLVVSEFAALNHNSSAEEKKSLGTIERVCQEACSTKITVWGRPDYMSALQNVTEKIKKSLKILEEFWLVPYPLPKLDCVALPNYQSTRPADNWGAILFK